jgi:hypothetical protein
MASIEDNSTMQAGSKALAMASLQVEAGHHTTNTDAKHTGTVYDDHDMQRMGKVQELKVIVGDGDMTRSDTNRETSALWLH